MEGSFEEVSSKAQTVIRAKVLDYVPVGDAQPQNLPPVAMSVEVLEQVKGKVEAKQIVLWGDNGMQCRPYLDQFLVGTEWLFAKGLQTSIAL
ncbi:MAG: hypothetical protein HC824_14600 [Synechococcales cyanobacterium RM1_1_8]|nr:hypothetical protein [Synechococcales cyanobacterium RM1_1_8]